MPHPLLTIGVPTYNRATDLDNLLASFVRELKKISPDMIEIIVSDNASNDGTPEVVRKHCEACPQIRSVRNDANIGMQANLAQCIDLATGEYIYLIGDDEVIVEDGLFTILSSIKNNTNVSIFIFNYIYEGNPEMPKMLQQACGHPIDTHVSNVKEFVFRHGWLWTLGNLAMVVARTAPLKATDRSPHMVHTFMQAGLYLDTFHKDQLLFVDKSIFQTFIRSQTVNKDRWEKDGTVAGWSRVFESIEYLIDKGVLPSLLPLGFYNHCSAAWFPSWNLLFDVVLKRVARGDMNIADDDWLAVMRWIVKVDNPHVRDRILNVIETLKVTYNITRASHTNFLRLSNLFRTALMGM